MRRTKGIAGLERPRKRLRLRPKPDKRRDWVGKRVILKTDFTLTSSAGIDILTVEQGTIMEVVKVGTKYISVVGKPCARCGARASIAGMPWEFVEYYG